MDKQSTNTHYILINLKRKKHIKRHSICLNLSVLNFNTMETLLIAGILLIGVLGITRGLQFVIKKYKIY